VSFVLPVLFHWSPREMRDGIKRRGLKPTCPTSLTYSAEVIPGTANGRWLEGEDASARMVCLGTSPSHAWSLSGAIFAERGDVFDLWQVTLDDEDEVHPLCFFGYKLDEIRVRNRIPKRRVWWVAERTVGVRRW
jgi:hypothetical protein